MFWVILLIFCSLLVYEIYCRKKEVKEKEKPTSNPYENTKWFIDGKRVIKDNNIPHKK